MLQLNTRFSNKVLNKLFSDGYVYTENFLCLRIFSSEGFSLGQLGLIGIIILTHFLSTNQVVLKQNPQGFHYVREGSILFCDNEV